MLFPSDYKTAKGVFIRIEYPFFNKFALSGEFYPKFEKFPDFARAKR